MALVKNLLVLLWIRTNA